MNPSQKINRVELGVIFALIIISGMGIYFIKLGSDKIQTAGDEIPQSNKTIDQLTSVSQTRIVNGEDSMMPKIEDKKPKSNVLPSVVWVCGITKDPPYIGERPRIGYVLFELDKDNEEYKDEVLKVYAEMKIPVLYHRIRRGWHFFGDLRPDEVKNTLQRRLNHLNFDGSLNTTLRIKRKTDDEVFELPIYQGPEPMPNWAKALRYFLTLEYKREITDYDKTAKKCGLYKYWKPQKGHSVIFYPLCHICLTALPTKPENKLKHYQDVHDMYKEALF